jgi:hypothetical protein
MGGGMEEGKGVEVGQIRFGDELSSKYIRNLICVMILY